MSSSSQASTSLTLQGSKSIKTTDSILGKLENEIEEIVNYLQLKIKNKEIFEEDNLVYTKLEKITRELEETPKSEINFLSDNLSDLICNAYALFNENHLLGVRVRSYN